MNRCRGFGDKLGDHAISCAINGERIAKHNHVRDAIFAAASQAALGARKEPAGLLPGSAGPAARTLKNNLSQNLRLISKIHQNNLPRKK